MQDYKMIYVYFAKKEKKRKEISTKAHENKLDENVCMPKHKKYTVN